MRGMLKITFMDGTIEYFDVDPVGDDPDMVQNLKTFLAAPDVTLFLDNELVVIPSTAIRTISITRSATTPLPTDELNHIPGVLVGVKRVVG